MFLQKIKNKKILHLLFIIILLLPSFLAAPKKSSAISAITGLVEEVGPNLTTNIKTTAAVTAALIPAKATAAATGKVWWKEYILDPVLWTLANVAIEKIADSTVDWINGGFNGGPSFVTDLGGFLESVGDQTVGDFISGSPLAFLCSPFSLDIKIALSLQFGGEREARCTLSDAFDNVNNAIDDLGNNWSWDKFNSISQSQNNAYGAYAEGYANLILKMAEAKDKEIVKSNWGGGFLSFDKCEDDVTKEECRPVQNMLGETTQVCTPVTTPGKCTTQTPGTTINASLTKVLGLGNDKLVAADEFNEIIAALLNQLINAVFNSTVGLFGSNPSNYEGSKISVSTVDELRTFINDAKKIETDYIAWKNQSLVMVNYAEAYLQALIACWKSYVVIPSSIDPNDPITPTQAEVDAKIVAAQLIIDTTIANYKTNLGIDIQSAEDNIAELEALLLLVPAGQEIDVTTFQDVYTQFQALTTLHTGSDIVSAEQEFKGPTTTGDDPIQTQMDAIITNVLTESAICKAGGGTFNPPTYTVSKPNCTLTAIPTNISPGGSSVLGWTSTNATSGFIDNGIGNTTPVNEGSSTVTPSTTTLYTGTFTGSGRTATCTAKITVTSSSDSSSIYYTMATPQIKPKEIFYFNSEKDSGWFYLAQTIPENGISFWVAPIRSQSKSPIDTSSPLLYGITDTNTGKYYSGFINDGSFSEDPDKINLFYQKGGEKLIEFKQTGTDLSKFELKVNLPWDEKTLEITKVLTFSRPILYESGDGIIPMSIGIDSLYASIVTDQGFWIDFQKFNMPSSLSSLSQVTPKFSNNANHRWISFILDKQVGALPAGTIGVGWEILDENNQRQPGGYTNIDLLVPGFPQITATENQINMLKIEEIETWDSGNKTYLKKWKMSYPEGVIIPSGNLSLLFETLTPNQESNSIPGNYFYEGMIKVINPQTGEIVGTGMLEQTHNEASD